MTSTNMQVEKEPHPLSSDETSICDHVDGHLSICSQLELPSAQQFDYEWVEDPVTRKMREVPRSGWRHSEEVDNDEEEKPCESIASQRAQHASQWTDECRLLPIAAKRRLAFDSCDTPKRGRDGEMNGAISPTELLRAPTKVNELKRSKFTNGKRLHKTANRNARVKNRVDVKKLRWGYFTRMGNTRGWMKLEKKSCKISFTVKSWNVIRLFFPASVQNGGKEYGLNIPVNSVYATAMNMLYLIGAWPHAANAVWVNFPAITPTTTTTSTMMTTCNESMFQEDDNDEEEASV
jgi:hypothetical protein